MPFALAGAGISSITGLIGGGKQADAAKQAAGLQVAEADKALALQQSQFNTQQTNIRPWLEAGQSALGTLQSQLPSLTQGFDPTKAGLPAQFSYSAADMQKDPGYQFAMQQGQQALDRSAAARGGALGGSAIKATEQYAQGTANQFYNQDFNRALNTYQQNYTNAFNTYGTNQANAFNRLSTVAGLGQTANTQLSQAGQHYADQGGNDMMQSGNAAASGVMGAANAWANALGHAGGTMGGAMSNPNVSSYLKSL